MLFSLRRFSSLLLIVSLAATTLAAETKKKGGYRGATPKPKATPAASDDADPTPRPKKKTISEEDSGEATPRPKKKSTAENSEEATPSPKKKSAAASEEDVTPAPGSKKKKKSGAAASPTPAVKGKTSEEPAAEEKEATPVPKKKGKSGVTPIPSPSSRSTPAPDESEGGGQTMKSGMQGPDVAMLSSDRLVELGQQPPALQRLIHDALALTEKNLGYLYGSAEPSRGGMDCSGTIYYLLRQAGYKDVPRDSPGQFLWLREKGTLRELKGEEMNRFDAKGLRPGDLLFWSGTYSIEREVPITHVMLFLGTEKDTGKPVMWGASDGRSYGGKSRYGVSVFDFKLPKAEAKSKFVGFGQLPPPPK